MTVTIQVSKPAPLKNVSLFATLVSKVVERQAFLPGMACFSSPSGYGKSRAAVFGANRYQGYYVECGQFTTAKNLLVMILKELGVPNPRGSIPDLIDDAIMRLAANPRRPLIVDEVHHIADKKFVDLLRELHDKSQSPVVLIGEEKLPKQLEAFERVHNRMLTWVQAVPLDMEDFALLSRTIYPDLEIAQDLAQLIIATMKGNTRRILVNLAEVSQRARQLGVSKMTRSDFEKLGPVIGRDAPTMRAI